MKNIDSNVYEDICISDIAIISGVRPAGRTVNNLTCGRKSNGMLYIYDGEAVFEDCNNKSLRVENGELLFIPKGFRYVMQYTAPNTRYVVVDLEMFDKQGNDVLLSRELAVLTKDQGTNQIARIIANLEFWGTSESLTALFRRKELVYKLLGEVYEKCSIPVLSNHRYPQIFAGVLMLEQSYLENLPVSKFAEVSNISISTFRQLFHKQYGMSPIQYRNRLRINRAVAVLSEGSCTVSEAAYACGFENIGYFCRYYKKVTGETPLETKRCQIHYRRK